MITTLLVVAGPGVRDSSAEDWPEFRGKGRLGIWNETGLLETFPESGLKARWRAPVKAGFAGPAVADERVFVTDWEPTQGMRGIERALALDETTGDVLWIQEWDADYAGIQWEVGPGATPTVDGDLVFVLGRTGVLSALKSETGDIVWRKSYGPDYGVDRMRWGFDWGFASAPLVDGSVRRELPTRTRRPPLAELPMPGSAGKFRVACFLLAWMKKKDTRQLVGSEICVNPWRPPNSS